MRARSERVAFTATGTSLAERTRTTVTIVVTGIAITRTHFATIQHRGSLRLQLVRTPRGWKVDSFRGAGQ